MTVLVEIALELFPTQRRSTYRCSGDIPERWPR
jgi:hypothetical protein